MATLILTGHVNLMNVGDPAAPFARVRDTFQAADLVFSNLECCLYQPPRGHSFHNEGFFADPDIGGEALRQAGIVTWADRDWLRDFTDDIAALRRQVDVVVASCRWGLHKEMLDYMQEIGCAAVDAGADIVIGHGPHYSLPIEVYRGKPIFYGLGSLSFHTGHGGRAHGNWIGIMVQAEFRGGALPLRAAQ